MNNKEMLTTINLQINIRQSTKPVALNSTPTTATNDADKDTTSRLLKTDKILSLFGDF
jgi:hypothetical protein